MTKTKNWNAIVTPKALIIGENSTLQWSDEVVEYVMFLDYFFRDQPYDHGERSRYAEARSIFQCINELSSDKYRPQEVSGTLLCMNPLQRPPRGKHLLIPEQKAKQGVKNIIKILSENPTIETVFVMSIQTNYFLQKFGFYGDNDTTFLHGAQPRNAGLENHTPYYQPVDAKVFGAVCGKVFQTTIASREVNVVPILPAKDYPLFAANIEKYSAAYKAVSAFFAAKKEQQAQP